MKIGRIALVSRKLLRHTDGSVITEFALLAPTVMALMLGVFQIGIGMQNYNAMRSIGSDVMRYAVVNYQTGNELSNDQIRFYLRSISIKNPYNLESSRLALSVTSVATPRVADTIEKSVTITYSIPTVLSFIGVDEFPITYRQPLILVKAT
ncbi:TadE/TadG family type IV pilus assembly protein [Novosphingobium taihuense]|uniref:Flp pilus assembly protein TadG n=1 Tax=Novosphingobium taihuense TaxID=260085 RepID=A0A7W7ACV4_9SPHN|nr:TadE family protein [Novosphingobium taihuense]MBB4613812.1 Flp pilus assembly protein TadG [Novosphingobium taihuense]TWH83320.1 TadE-like protein [Novosphingobium taihuense]